MDYKIPKYVQIKADIINDIKKGVLQPGDKVDGETKLKKKYGVSTITVRKAFDDLINEDYLVGVQGVGTFVRKRRMIRGLTSISFSDELLQQGYKIDIFVDKIDEIKSTKIAETLEIPAEQSIIRVGRVRYANDEPVAYHISFVDSRLISLEEAQKIHEIKSFYKTLEKFDVKPEWVNENYTVKQVQDSNIAKLMNVKKNSDTFFVKRKAYDELDNIIEYSETYFNKDWYSVTVNIKI